MLFYYGVGKGGGRVIKVALVDDQKLLVEGLTTIIDSSEDLKVIGKAFNGEEALIMVKNLNIDVILLDIRMPGKNGVEVVKDIRCTNKDVKIVMLTTFDDEEYIIEALANGADGYLLKDIESNTLKDTIRKAYKGDLIMPSKIAKVLARRALDMREEKHNSKLDNLSEREREIATMIEKGFTNKQIASALYMSEGTVKNYVSAIYGKFGVNDRTNLVIVLKNKEE